MSERTGRSIPWRPQSFFSHQVHTARAFEILNEHGGIAVDFQAVRKTKPHLTVEGGQSRSMSLWLTQSTTGFITVPKLEADLFTIRFVTSGSMTRRSQSGEHLGYPGYAMFVAFEDMRNEEASANFAAMSGTITRSALLASHQALDDTEGGSFPQLDPVAPIDNLPMQSFLMCFRQIHKRLRQVDPASDLFFNLLDEIVSYQLLSCWPRRRSAPTTYRHGASSEQLRRAMEYIDAQIAQPMRLADIAAAAGVSVRALQNSFKRELGTTPLSFIVERRLQRVHGDLQSQDSMDLSIAEVARRWGFVHVSDFTQRYRKRFNRTPSETRRQCV
ncbi:MULTISPECIES: helix-turn-helix domain-containing protein [Methylobacterium]|uniref:helix-turn-helix domain-containing protein n=1 Tax=Methylobacterium TaxID=407 RepID=UPI0013EA5C80|nr:helix-turn-helix transcriptional regulator [Methylobacterium sp. DB0501]NGM34803.1 helix-turn-helix transcriptional regulator [Methylobacterium sp. DB0501]